jgi:hypothetical protein
MRKASGPANYPSDRIPVGYFGAVKRTSSGTIGYAIGGALLAMGTILTIAGFFLGRCAVHVDSTWIHHLLVRVTEETEGDLRETLCAKNLFHAQNVRTHGKEWKELFECANFTQTT